MTPGQLITVVAVLGAALLLSETMLSALRLHRLRVGAFGWAVGVLTLAVAAYWSDQNTSLDPGRVHLVAVSIAGLLTCLWFNDHQPVPPKITSPDKTPDVRVPAKVG